MRYAIDGGVQISKVRVPLITIKSIAKINATHLFVKCRQLRRNTHRTHAKQVDCIGTFTMQSEINHNNSAYTYTFKSIDDEFLKDLNLTLFEVDFKILLDNQYFELVHMIKPTNSLVQVKDRRVSVEGEYAELNLKDGDDVLLEIQNDKNQNTDIIKCQINQSIGKFINLELPDEMNDIAEINVDIIHCIVNRCTIFMDYFEH